MGAAFQQFWFQLSDPEDCKSAVGSASGFALGSAGDGFVVCWWSETPTRRNHYILGNDRSVITGI
jgi:hypothetical protein